MTTTAHEIYDGRLCCSNPSIKPAQNLLKPTARHLMLDPRKNTLTLPKDNYKSGNRAQHIQHDGDGTVNTLVPTTISPYQTTNEDLHTGKNVSD